MGTCMMCGEISDRGEFFGANFVCDVCAECEERRPIYIVMKEQVWSVSKELKLKANTIKRWGFEFIQFPI